jgi:hypothetical protein
VVVVEILIVTLGILAVLIGTGAVMDLRARRTRRRLSVDDRAANDHRRTVDGRSTFYDGGRMDGGV